MTELLYSLFWIWLVTVGAFTVLNNLASVASKKAAYEIVVSNLVDIKRLPKVAEDLFERIFGARHFSWRCLLGSIIASLITVFSLYILRMILVVYINRKISNFEDQYLNFIWQEMRYPFQDSTRLSFAISIVINLMLDYIALLKTRLLIKALTRVRLSPFLALVFIVLDSIISFTLFEGFYLLLYAIVFLSIAGAKFFLSAGDPYGYFRTAEVTILLIFLISPGYPPGAFHSFLTYSHAISISLIVALVPISRASIFFYASIMPSIWLWIFLFAVVVARLVASNYPWMLRALDFEQNPLRTLGCVFAMLLSLLWLLLVSGLMFYFTLIMRL
jgi:hypothetical protein